MTATNSDLLHCLTDLGMSEREARVYLAMLPRRDATATDLQKHSGVPQSKIYEVIGSLMRQGLCLERKIGRHRTFEILDPAVSLASSFAHLHTRFRNVLTHQKELEDLFHRHKLASEPLESLEILRGNDNIHHRYCQLVRVTNEELLGFGRGPYACDTEEKSSQQDEEEAGVLARGGVMRWVYEFKLPEDRWIIDDLKALQAKGARIRIAESLPIKMMIFDQQTLLVAEEEPFMPSPELTMAILKQKTTVNAFRALFEFFWAQAVELKRWEQQHPSQSTVTESTFAR